MKFTRRTFAKNILFSAAALLTVGFSASAQAAINVVATIPELGAITKEVGGGNVSVYTIARPNRDYHQIEPRPSDVSRVANARLIVCTGMQFEGWMDALTRATGNTALMGNGS